MLSQPSHVFALFFGITVVLLLVWLFVRGQQGSQQSISLTGRMFLPLLASISIAFSYLYNSQVAGQRHGNSCPAYIAPLTKIGIGLTILAVIAGLFFYLRYERSTRVLSQALLLIGILATVLFVLAYLNGCIQ